MKKVDIIEIFLAQRGKCFYCGRPMSWMPGSYSTSYTKDHFEAKSKGHSLNGNMVLAHEPCNSKKSNRDPIKRERQRFKYLYRRVADRMAEIRKMKKGNKKHKKDFGRW